MRYSEIITENAKFDNEHGWGATPLNSNIDYMGLRVKMKPSTFLKLARAMDRPHTQEIEDHIAGGGSIGNPFLIIQIPPEWMDGNFEKSARVMGHEGRNRMSAIEKVHGDWTVEVHLSFRSDLRNRHITEDMVANMKKGMWTESGDWAQGPLFVS